jgi:hypothetical protein
MKRQWVYLSALRHPGSCSKCARKLAAGQRAYWRSTDRALRCTICHTQLADTATRRDVPMTPRGDRPASTGVVWTRCAPLTEECKCFRCHIELLVDDEPWTNGTATLCVDCYDWTLLWPARRAVERWRSEKAVA